MATRERRQHRPPPVSSLSGSPSRDTVERPAVSCVAETIHREMSYPRFTPTPAAALAALVAAAVILAAAPAGARTPPLAASRLPAAHAARVLNVRDEGHLHFIRASGSLLIDEGRAGGSFPGTVKVRFLYDGEPNVSAQFTISGSGGSISARGTGRLSSPVSATPSFKGAMTITGGSGRYAHIHGRGELFGVFNRRTYALTVQAIGKLPY